MSQATPSPAADDFRSIAGRFATGVTVATTVFEGVTYGMTVNAFMTVSLEPLLVAIAVDRDATMHDQLIHSRVFAITVLSSSQEHLSRHFASEERHQGPGQFADVASESGPVTGSPVLEGGLAWMDCRVSAIHPGGDHTLFVGQVEALDGPFPGDPLVFYASGYHQPILDSGLDPGA